MAMELAEAPHGSFSVANEEHNLGDIVRTNIRQYLLSWTVIQHALHNHTRLPQPLDPHGNLGLLAVLAHILGDAVNSEYQAHLVMQTSIFIVERRYCRDCGGFSHVENSLTQ